MSEDRKEARGRKPWLKRLAEGLMVLALAGMVHRYYTMHQVIGAAEPGLALARLALLNAAGQVLRNGLAILGVSAPESM